MTRSGRPARHSTANTVDGYLGWLARTLRYDAHDEHLATATAFAHALAEQPGTPSFGPAMISRLEGGTARWRVEHLIVYARVLGLPWSRLLAPSYKVSKLFGSRRGIASLLRIHYTDEEEQTAADLVDALYGDDPINTDSWDLLSGYLLVTRRKLGMRTWRLLCERLLLEICATQGADQDIRAEALVRIMAVDRVAEIANEFAIGIASQAGNPMSFMPLKIFQRLPRKAPSDWIVRSLLDPPDRWLLRELFTSVDVLTRGELWEPSTKERAALRTASVDAALDAHTEMEVKRSSLRLLDILDPAAARRVLHRVGDGELVYRAKPSDVTDAQRIRYREFAEQFATTLQEIGPKHRSKWVHGEDRVLVEVVTETLFGSGAAQSGYTALLTNSGYRDALSQAVTDHLADTTTYQDVTVARAMVRLAGKVVSGPAAGRTLLRIIGSSRLDVDTRVQTAWALANAAPRLPRKFMDGILDIRQDRSFGSQAVTVLRAIIAASARAGNTTNLRSVLDDDTAPSPARQECAWWLSLPPGVLAAMQGSTPTSTGSRRVLFGR
ncbi:hypothetical protein [Actinocrispum wychmicini]|uniref:Uncharacterized protein n=1 Tax=Actinocrispum wychmicini TaxID=1213861 RepID=A0A4R2JQF1_9PSEU|nr:hypothetical protein [Actinocrispum wychmicini]TCO59416.1 hypothetical protein EV192_104258 [Actinocrispum wychmicini]